MIVVAVASGTSVDALDVAAVELAWAEPGVAGVRVRGHRSVPWPADLRDRVLALLPPAQTVHHEVVGDRCHGTLQLGQPAWIAEATGLAAPAERDVSAAESRSELQKRHAQRMAKPASAALDLGGIANVTVVAPGEPVVAFDTGPANCLLDLAAQRVSGGRLTRDDDGRLAGAGTVRPDLLDRLLDHPYFRLDPPKSTGRETFSADLLDTALAGLPPVDAADLLATLTALTTRTVAAALEPYDVAELVVSGGGVRNPALMAALRSALPTVSVVTSDERGAPADAKEAVMWALLGFLTWHGVPGTAPGHKGAVTGAEATRPPTPHPMPLERLTLRPIGAAA